MAVMEGRDIRCSPSMFEYRRPEQTRNFATK